MHSFEGISGWVIFEVIDESCSELLNRHVSHSCPDQETLDLTYKGPFISLNGGSYIWSCLNQETLD